MYLYALSHVAIHFQQPETLWKASDQDFQLEFNLSEIFSYKFLAM